MKKLLRFSALLTIFALLTPALVAALPLKSVEPSVSPDFVSRSYPMAAESSPAFPAGTTRFDEKETVTVWDGQRLETMTLRDYLEGVLAAEMPADFPEEALKAQAVAARTYTLYKMAMATETEDVHHGAQLCTDPAHCEAFLDLAAQAAAVWGDSAEVYSQRISRAVEETDGLILTYQNEPIAAVFCAASAGQTESAYDVWGTELPYLVNVDSPGGQACGKYLGEVRVAQSVFRDAVAARHPEASFSDRPEEWITDAERSPAGGVKYLTVGGVRVSGREIRQCFDLNSTNFTIRAADGDLIFSTVGYGHGVGLSQFGARHMALSGEGFETILSHYYPGTQLNRRSSEV
ncbi:MAG: stage II sporulation protein D [Clostridia bacterium]|nr:stage II sporulation protein D [Clostridia bacterium]